MSSTHHEHLRWCPWWLFGVKIAIKWFNRKLTSIMWPVEMSMFEWAGSSLQEEMLLRAEGLTAGPPSLNWDDTLLILEEIGSGRSVGGLTAMRCRQSSCRREDGERSVSAVMELGTSSVITWCKARLIIRTQWRIKPIIVKTSWIFMDGLYFTDTLNNSKIRR